MTIDKEIEDALKDESPTAAAVNSLIKVEKRELGDQDSDIELKTDLSEDQVSIHTVTELVFGLLDTTPKQFTEKNVIGQLVTKKERKLLSKDRASRGEIVAIARQPDLNMTGTDAPQNENFLKRFFTSRKQPPQ